jgi:class 3 adenylate cyclase/DNA-binding CsgD family transcriptional regulator/tetratricopeptide (TPR) repeat protein
MPGGTEEDLLTILVTDLVRSTDLHVRAGDRAAQQLVQLHDELVRGAVEEHGGRLVKGLGDGALVTFASARRALTCAVAIQQRLDDHNQRHPDDQLQLRIGLNSGEVLHRDADVHGAAVAAAARIAACAAGGEILVADIVLQAAGTMPALRTRPKGAFELKGFGRAFLLHQVLWREEQETTARLRARPAVPSPGHGELLCPILVGRHRELELLLAALRRARKGEGGVVVVVGEAGVGKSRLARELAGVAADQGCTVLTGRAVGGGSPQPYRPFAEALAAAARHGLTLDAAELVPFRAPLGRLVPDWVYGDERQIEASVVAVAEGVLRVLRALAGTAATVLVLDDLHWADPESVAILEYLAAYVPAEPVMCVVTSRLAEAPGLAVPPALLEHRTAQVLELARLTDAEVEAMTRACLDLPDLPGELEEFLRSRADGLPFLVEELLAGLAASRALVAGEAGWQLDREIVPSVPLTFAASVHRRLSGLDEATRATLAAAAVLGRRFDWSLLSAITGLDEGAVLGGLRQAVDAQLLTIDAANGFRFRHALTRDAVAEELLPPERAALSRRALEAIEQRHPGLPGEWCELAAELSERSGQRHRAAQLLHEGARRALARGALASAEATLDRALALAPDDALLASSLEETLTEVLALAGKTERVFAVGERLLVALASMPAGPERLAEVHLRLARAAVMAGQWDRAAAQVAQAREPGTTAGEALTCRVDALAAHLAMGQGRADEAEELARGALRAATEAALPAVACEALEVIGRCARPRDMVAAEAVFEQARRLAEDHGLDLWRIRALHELGTIDLFSTFRLDRLEIAREAAVRSGALATIALIDLHRAAILGGRGRLDEALAAARSSAETSARFGLATLAMAHMMEATVQAWAGRRQETEAAIARALEAGPGDLDVLAGAWGRARALLSLSEADWRRAGEELDRAMEFVRRFPAVIEFPFRGLWALLQTLAGPGGDAARDEVRSSLGMGMLLNRVCLECAEAIAVARAGDGEAATRRFEAALADQARLEEADWLRHVMTWLVAQAAVEDGWGSPASWLRPALSYFEAQGLDRLAKSCRGLLRRAGVPVPRKGRGASEVPAPLAAAGVTSREMDVLSLVAEGLTNRQIGERLHLSERTVEKHVASLLVRLGLQRRVQLAGAFLRATSGPGRLSG